MPTRFRTARRITSSTAELRSTNSWSAACHPAALFFLSRLRFVCGYFGCERHMPIGFFLPAIADLMIKMNLHRASQRTDSKLSRSALVSRPDRRGPDSVLLSKMAEALFIETIRRYMEALPPEQTGWLFAARDAVAKASALAALFLASLDAGQKLTPRSRPRARFSPRGSLAFLGEPPLTYLARWRLQPSGGGLQTTRDAGCSRWRGRMG